MRGMLPVHRFGCRPLPAALLLREQGARAAPPGRSVLGSLQEALHLASLLCRDIGQIVEAGIPELIDVQRRLPGRKRLKRAVGELDDDALLLEALQGVVHVEVYVDAESI